MRYMLSVVTGCLAALSFFVSCPTATAQTVQTNSLDSMRTICSAAVDRIATDAQSKKDDALAQYGRTLDAILKSLKTKGDIDAYLVIEQEAKRFQKEITVPATAPHPYVANAVALYQKQVQSIEIDADRRTASLYRQYIAALGNRVRDFMAQDYIEDAKAAGQAKRDAESALAAIEIRMPKATVPDQLREAKTVKATTDTAQTPMEMKTRSLAAQWQDVTRDMVGGERTKDGIVLKNQRTETKESYSVPIEIEYVVKTDSTNIRISYACGDHACDQMIFNWEVARDDLIIGKSLQRLKGKGRVPIGKFVTIRQVVTEKKMCVYVDGRQRVSWESDFSNWSSPIAVFSPDFHPPPTLTVKSVRVRKPTDDQ